MSSHKVYAISGLSATGKTTIGRRIENDFLIDEVKRIEFIDQDWYYKDNKPKVLLSSGEHVSNWDCVEAIYWGTLNADVKYKLKSRDVLLVGFALWENMLEFPIERHVHLTYSDPCSTIKDGLCPSKKDIQKCIDGRMISKKLKTLEKQQKDKLMVEEIVFPFYLETLKKSKIDDFIAVYDKKDRRRDINVLVREVKRSFGLLYPKDLPLYVVEKVQHSFLKSLLDDSKSKHRMIIEVDKTTTEHEEFLVENNLQIKRRLGGMSPSYVVLGSFDDLVRVLSSDWICNVDVDEPAVINELV